MSKLRIVKGNAFTTLINITAISPSGDAVVWSLTDSTNIEVSAVSKTKKVLLSHTIVSKNELTAVWKGNLPVATYGIEVKGTYNGRAWRLMDEAALDIVFSNEEACIPEDSIVDGGYLLDTDFHLVGGGTSAQAHSSKPRKLSGREVQAEYLRGGLLMTRVSLTTNNPINPNNMRQELKFYRTAHSIEIEADGKVIATMPMAEEQPTPAPEPEPTPKSVTYTFEEWKPQVTHTRLTEPKGDWAVLHCISENQKSVHLQQNVQSVGDMLVLTVKPQSAKYGDAEKAYTSGLAYSRRMFRKGRLDVRANLSGDKAVKNSIWVTTSAMTDKATGLRYLYEWDWVEYTPADTGSKNTSRGMWMWQENAQSVSDKALPYIFPDKGYSLSGGCWWWTGKAWTQGKLYNIYRNGNRLKGHPSGRTYYITNTERGKEIDSADLMWIRDDGKIGQGLDGNQWFVVTEREPLGLGADKSQFLDGKTSISGWHIWSLIVDDDYIAYLCDGKEYWRISNDQLHELTIQDNITFNIIFATNVIGTPKGNVEMQVDYVKFTPKE